MYQKHPLSIIIVVNAYYDRHICACAYVPRMQRHFPIGARTACTVSNSGASQHASYTIRKDAHVQNAFIFHALYLMDYMDSVHQADACAILNYNNTLAPLAPGPLLQPTDRRSFDHMHNACV